MIILFFLIQFGFCQILEPIKNYLSNPSFEEGDPKNENIAVGWTNWGKGCKRVRGGRTGKWCGYCNKQQEGESALIQWIPSGTIQEGLKYNVSAWIKIKNMHGSEKGHWMFALEGAGYSSGVYPTHKNIPECADGHCVDQWYFLTSGKSEMTFKQGRYQATMYFRGGALGEFWVDDVSFEPVIENYIYSCEVVSWRQEVFEDEVEVRIATNLWDTIFENGNYSMYKLEVFNKKNEIVQTSRQFMIWKHFEQVVVSMPLKPKDLPAGYYTVRTSFYNNITCNLEMVTTTFRKLEKKRTVEDYKTFVDVDNRCFVDNKLFFPLGCYVNEYNKENIKNFTDSPFNLMVSNARANKHWLDRIYNESEGKVRLINGFGSATRGSVEEAIKYTKEKIEAWKDSPGLFGYYIADEPGLYRLPAMNATTWTVRELDPTHITWSAVNQRFQLGRLKEGFDTVGMDDYPVQTYDSLQSIWVMTKQGRVRMGNTRALWNIPQIFDWTVYNESYPDMDMSKEFPPTEPQLKNMVYQWIAAGGMGIIYYDYSEVVIMHYKSDYYTEWEKIKKVTKELKDVYSPIILSNIPINPGYTLPISDGLDFTNYVAVRQFRYQHADYILIVNVRNVNNYKYTIYKPKGATLEKIDGKSTYEVINDTIVNIVMPGMDVLWFKGKGDSYDADETNYDKPNLKSKFVEAKSKTNEDIGEFPTLPDVPLDPARGPAPSSNNNNTNNAFVLSLSLILLILLFI